MRGWWGRTVLQVTFEKHIENGFNLNKPKLSAMCRPDPKRDKNKLCNLVKRRRSLYPSGGISTVQRTVCESDSLSHRTLQNTYRHKRGRTHTHEPLSLRITALITLILPRAHSVPDQYKLLLPSCSVSASVIRWGAYDTAAVQEDQGPCLQRLHKFLSFVFYSQPSATARLMERQRLTLS